MKKFSILFLLVLFITSAWSQNNRQIYIGGMFSTSLDQFTIDYDGSPVNYHPNNSVGARIGYQHDILKFLTIYGEIGADLNANIYIRSSNGFRNESSFRFSRTILGLGAHLNIETGNYFLDRLFIGGGIQYVNFFPMRLIENNTIIIADRAYESTISPIFKVGGRFVILKKIAITPQLRYRILSTQVEDDNRFPLIEFEKLNLNNLEFACTFGYLF